MKLFVYNKIENSENGEKRLPELKVTDCWLHTCYINVPRIQNYFSTVRQKLTQFCLCQIQTVPVPNCKSTLFCLSLCSLSVLFVVFLCAVLGEQSAQPWKSCGSSCLRTNLTSSVPSKSTTPWTKVCSVTFMNHSVLNGSGVTQLIRQIYHVLPLVVSQRTMSG